MRENNIPHDLDGQSFADSPIDRRDFVRLAAATTGALALPRAASAQKSSDKTTDIYEYLLNHTPTSDKVQTLIKLSDTSGFSDLQDLETNVRTIQQPSTAAYAQLTPDQAQQALEIEAVTQLQFAPGSNPFWRLGAYDDGVFPAPTESPDFIDFEEMIAGMEYLKEQNPDRLRFSSIGESAGIYNFVTRESETKNIWLGEITNQIDDESSYQDKEKVLIYNVDSSERQGPEALFRFVEDLLGGDEPTVEDLLDDVVVLFLIVNPDGWVAKHTQYFSGERVSEDEIVRTNEYLTVLPQRPDPNRSYPTPGYMDPENYPAEAAGSNLTDDEEGVDSDVPEYLTEDVPGLLDIVDHFRTRNYKNLNYVFDLHGQGDSEYFLESFPLNGDYDFGDLKGLYELMESLDQAVQESDLAGMLSQEVFKSVFREINQETAAEEEDVAASDLAIPTKTFVYGTLFDTLGYSTSGDMLSWFCAGEENGGLGLKGYANETVFSISTFRPKLVEAWVAGNIPLIRTTIEHAARDLEPAIETEGASTAYVTTDALTRSSDSLSFPSVEGTTVSEKRPITTFEREKYAEEITAGSRMALQVSVPTKTRELGIKFDPSSTRVILRSTSGREVRTYDPATVQSGFGRPVKWTVPAPESGDWTLEFDNTTGTTSQQPAAAVGYLQAEESPDPREALEFQQRAYEVSPFTFFEEYQQYISDDGTITAVTINEVRSGTLSDGDSPNYENVVVIHSEGADDEEYVAALDEYVRNGGNLVLTDSGIAHLGVMSNELVNSVDSDAVFEETLFTSYLGERSENHPLLAGTVSSQSEVGKFIPLGYSVGDDAPMTLVDPNAFCETGGSVAATTAGEYMSLPNDTATRPGVSAGSITNGNGSVQVIGGLLPPATQDYLHPFGMNEYSISGLGMSLMTNALGYDSRIEPSETDDTDDIYQGPGDDDDGDDTWSRSENLESLRFKGVVNPRSR